MLGFKQYQKSLVEAGNPPMAAPVAAPVAAKELGAEAQKLASEIDKVIDQWVAELKKDLISGSLTSPKMGLWDRLKGSLANIWYGRRNVDNPYYFRNQFGDLGRMETQSHGLPVADYRSLRETVDSAESSIAEAVGDNAERLKIFQIINQKAAQLKQSLRDAIGASLPKKFEMPPLSSFPQKEKPEAQVSVARPDKEEDKKPEAVPQQPKQDEKQPVDLSTPPTQNTPWERLSRTEKEKWNDYGGGPSPVAPKFKLFPLPLILRLGDPRIGILYPELRKKLENAKRIEQADAPIASKEDLDKAIAGSVRSSLSTAEASARDTKREEPEQADSGDARDPEGERRHTASPESPEDQFMNPDAGQSRFDSNEFDFADSPEERSGLRSLIAHWPEHEEKRELLKTVERPMNKDKALRALTKIKGFLKRKVDELNISGEDEAHVANLMNDAKTVVDFQGVLTALESLDAAPTSGRDS